MLKSLSLYLSTALMTCVNEDTLLTMKYQKTKASYLYNFLLSQQIEGFPVMTSMVVRSGGFCNYHFTIVPSNVQDKKIFSLSSGNFKFLYTLTYIFLNSYCKTSLNLFPRVQSIIVFNIMFIVQFNSMKCCRQESRLDRIKRLTNKMNSDNLMCSIHYFNNCRR